MIIDESECALTRLCIRGDYASAVDGLMGLYDVGRVVVEGAAGVAVRVHGYIWYF
jgi:hypothetical protein